MAADSESFVCLEDFEKSARKHLLQSRVDYFTDGCNEQFTLKENIEAFKRYRLRPRLLRDVSKIDLSTTLLGQHIFWPVGVSPTAFHRIADYAEGEKATARATHSEGSVMILSCASTCTIEDVATASASGILWMQVMFFKRREITESLVKRAEAAGFKAIVVTIDQPVFGKKYSIDKNKTSVWFKLHAHERPVNLNLGIKDKGGEIAATLDRTATWEEIKWLKSITNLPLVLKGITTGDQARNAVEHGASGILVSNHGGRQLDYLPATIDVLPEVVAAVEGSGVEVYLDGGVRHGTDVFKALARGARAVFIGRPIIWGLTCKGYEGAKQVLSILREEVNTTMSLMGCTNVNEIAPSMVVHEDYFRKSKL
ncbi:hydroxyacid oxidase 1-like [Anneissia japonica]|uniref:hydroxyacid oxidase 1-like n=1 Tax=Anneissia japonica TaxID=1529436 RepID=UPI001425A91C|nr:hydroxyacid oxidase 1-like [Anneissia japonica]